MRAIMASFTLIFILLFCLIKIINGTILTDDDLEDLMNIDFTDEEWERLIAEGQASNQLETEPNVVIPPLDIFSAEATTFSFETTNYDYPGSYLRVVSNAFAAAPKQPIIPTGQRVYTNEFNTDRPMNQPGLVPPSPPRTRRPGSRTQPIEETRSLSSSDISEVIHHSTPFTFEIPPLCDRSRLPTHITFPRSRSAKSYSSAHDLCSFDGKRRMAARDLREEDFTQYGQDSSSALVAYFRNGAAASRNLGCTCQLDSVTHQFRLNCHPPPVSDEILHQSAELHSFCSGACNCPPGPPIPNVLFNFGDGSDSRENKDDRTDGHNGASGSGGGSRSGEVWRSTSGSVQAYYADGNIMLSGASPGRYASAVNIIAAKKGMTKNAILSITLAIAMEKFAAIRAEMADTPQRARLGAVGTCGISKPDADSGCSNCGKRCESLRDCGSRLNNGCRCKATRRSRGSKGGQFSARCAMVSQLVGAGGSILGRRGIGNEGFVDGHACACNASYVSVGCCGSEDGAVIEDPRLKLGVLV